MSPRGPQFTQAPVQWLADAINERPWTVLVGYLVLSSLAYGVVSRFSAYPPIPVRPTAVDAWIPLMPETAIPYLSYFLLFPSVVVLGRTRPHLDRVMLTGLLCVVCNIGINVLVPTEVVPRIGPERVPGTLLALILEHDGSLCAFPSGHVSLPVALTIATRRAGWAVWPLFAGWTAMLFVCTLTTGQHYFPDPVGGLLWGLGIGVIGGPWIDRRL